MNFKQIIFVAISSTIIIAFIFITFILSPNNSSGPHSSATTIHYVSHISPAHQKVIDNFNKKYEGRIKVETINLPFEKFSTNERKELLARFLRSKSDRIDVFTVDQIWVPRFAKWALTLDPYFEKSDLNNLLEYAHSTCYYKDSLVSLPLYLDVAVMYYRKDKIKTDNSLRLDSENTITWEQLIQNWSPNNTQNPVFLFPADDYEGLMCMFVEMLDGLGSPLIQNNKLMLETKQSERALRLMIDLINKYNITPKNVVTFRENECYNLFLKSDGIFLRGWPALLKDHAELVNQTDLGNKIGIAPVPYFKDGKQVSVFGGWNLMISKFSSKKNESIIFIKYLLSEEVQKLLHNDGGYLPVVASLYKNNPELEFYSTIMKRGIHRPFLENYTKISDIIVSALNRAIRGEQSISDALRSANEKIINENIEIK